MFPMNSPSQPNFMMADPMRGMLQPSQNMFNSQNPSPMTNQISQGDMTPFFPSLGATQGLPGSSGLGAGLPQYARGGQVRPRKNVMAHMAQIMSQMGEGDDKILAHINPQEAAFLSKNSLGGGSINPKTGLPQFGGWKNFTKMIGPLLGTAIGTMVGGPIGGAIGGGIGGSFGHPNDRMGFGSGAAMGGALGSMGSLFGGGMGGMGSMGSLFSGMGGMGTPMAGSVGGGNSIPTYSEDVIGKAFNGPGIPSQYLSKGNGGGLAGLFGGSSGGGLSSLFGGGSNGGGLSSLFGGGGGGSGGGLSSLFGGGSNGGGLSSLFGGGGGGSGGLSSLLGGSNGSTGGSLLDTILAGTAIAGTLGRKEKHPEQSREFKWEPRDYEGRIPDQERVYQAPPLDYVPGVSPEHEYFSIQKKKKKPVNMRHGGFLGGDTDGQADEIDAKLCDGEYVLRADVVSGLGNGNNKNGAKKLDRLQKNVLKQKAVKGFPPPAKKDLRAYMIKGA